uniref:hypothetical protein n=1 Tax=Desulfogranum japonicum TaxID=231447 RepID=UPI00196A1311
FECCALFGPLVYYSVFKDQSLNEAVHAMRICFSAEAQLNLFLFFRQQKSFAFCCLVCDALLSRATGRQNTVVGGSCQRFFSNDSLFFKEGEGE